MSNILLTLNAPFFVTAEILQAFGWKKKEFNVIQTQINERIAKFKSKVKKN